jgi:hypothetical protein
MISSRAWYVAYRFAWKRFDWALRVKGPESPEKRAAGVKLVKTTRRMTEARRRESEQMIHPNHPRLKDGRYIP